MLRSRRTVYVCQGEKDLNVLQNLLELYNQLPSDSTYRVVIKGILENMNFAADATIYDIAELTDSSRTTVWRMVQKMGYKNYSDFRYALKAAVSQYTYYNRIISPQVEKSSMVLECTAQIKAAAKIIEKNITTSGIEKLAQKLHSKKQIRFYLHSRSYAVYSFQQNLSMDGKDTAYYGLLPEMLADADSLTSDSIVFVNSIEFSETMDLSLLLSRVKERGGYIILANCGKSRYEAMADEILFQSVDFSETLGVTSNIVFETYIVILSEIYRRCFL